ncbi:MAG: DUF4177 domain-containing protein [Deltaproteobacteria bacterium]|nr:DUF4177 domain-containing protein [Deltaproteobacteria bacterium]
MAIAQWTKPWLHPDEGETVAILYKVIELSSVNDEDIEQALNEWTAQGWAFDTMQFAMRESSKRPSMAFITFTRNDETSD